MANKILDPDAYLPLVTKSWCDRVLLSLGFDPAVITMEAAFPDKNRTHCDAYLGLRSVLQLHIASGEGPILMECEKPVGGYNTLFPASVVQCDNSSALHEIDLLNDDLSSSL